MIKQFLLILVAVLGTGCLSSETLDLSRKIAQSTATQEQSIKEIVAELKVQDELTSKIISRAKMLTQATSGLADLLGAPKEVK